MPYGIRHTKKVYLAPRGIKKTKNRFSQRGKKNAFMQQGHTGMSEALPAEEEPIMDDTMETMSPHLSKNKNYEI